MKKIEFLTATIFLLTLLIPSIQAYEFISGDIKVTVFDSYGSQIVRSNTINLTYAVKDLGYFKTAVLNLSTPLSLTYVEKETTTIPGGSSGPTAISGGGGNVADLSFTPSEISVDILQESFFRDFIIKNIGNIPLKNIEFIINLPSFIRLENFNVSLLKPGEEKAIRISFARPSGILPGLYTGIISVEQPRFKKSMLLLINVIKLNPLIALDIERPLNFTRLNPGQNLDIQLALTNLAGEKPASIDLFYSLISPDNKELVSKTETITLDDSRLINLGLTIPADIRPGNYIFYTKVNYKGNTEDFGSALIEVFEIPKVQPTQQGKLSSAISSYATKALSTSKRILSNPVYLVVIAIAFIFLIQIIFRSIKKEFR